MPAYNCEAYIGDALRSILAQTYLKWEVIIVDDCSQDSTSDVVRRYAEVDNRIKYYRLHENSGAAKARNKGIEMAVGQYIAFLDSDDVWSTYKLEKQINFMRENQYTFTCTSYDKIDENGVKLNREIIAKVSSDYDGLLKTCPGNSTVIYDAVKIGKFFIPNIRKRNDYVMWLSVIKRANMLYGLQETLASHRVRSGSISSKKIDLVSYHWKVYREIEKLSFFKSCFLVFYWVIFTVLKLR
ncbi:glycosyltransferase family 2 protein [Paenibacillus antri]|uniref:Glycosyltransferase family 2 protein n=2 Tax=Paenibacillus antri TaxID=2582848 RepID=A0A5R9GHC4_9BACL|nr:glycosyltransferase family 2 protein [Paenibacillus antri]